MEVMELFNMLESNNIQVVEDIKKKFTDFFSLTKDTWLVNGLVDYYLQTNSLRIVDILVKVQGPHDKHLFDRLMDMVRTSQHKVQALTILGHVIRRQPSWLYKIAQHALLKEVLKLLKVETDIVTIMSALLSISALLPMIPSLITPFLLDFFDIFSRLASWNCNNPSKLPDEQLVHLQFGLVALFHRLYGMFPCNFFAYLQREYSSHEKSAIFSHTIKPLLETVKMHPLLVTANKDLETNTKRWKNMEVHDVVIECSRLSLDSLDRTNEAQECITTSARYFDYGSPLDSSVTYQLQQALISSGQYLSPGNEIQAFGYLSTQDKDMWSPTVICPVSTPPQTPTPNTQTYSSNSAMVPTSLGTGLSSSAGGGQEGASPPEAAVEATPETTPLKDSRTRPLPGNSSAARALDSKWLTRSAHNTPGQSQPSSPMKKEPTSFRFPPEGSSSGFEHASISSQKLTRVIMDRTQSQTESPNIYKSPIMHPSSPLRIPTTDIAVPTSPTSESQLHDGSSTRSKAERAALRFDGAHHESSQEDKEVTDINNDGDKQSELQECDDKFDVCEHHHGSPCTAGGLHIPNPRSMLDFARRVKRLRFYSQCVTDNTGGYYKGFSAGTSPADTAFFPNKGTCFRRTKSCPEIKRSPSRVSSPSSLLDVTEQYQHLKISKTPTPGQEEFLQIKKEIQLPIAPTRNMQHSATQTVSFWPQPYEHLFVGLFPQLDAAKSSPTQSPAPSCQMESSVSSSKSSVVSPCAMLDRYIEGCVHRRSSSDKPDDKGHDNLQKRNSIEDASELRALREQLELVHIQLQFERHRREVHAERNRRLLGKSRDNRALEESNSALRVQLILHQNDIDTLNKQLENKRKQYSVKEKEQNDVTQYWQDKYSTSANESAALNATMKYLSQQLNEKTVEHTKTASDLQEARAALFDAHHVMKQAMHHAEVSDQLRCKLQHMQTEMVIMGELQIKYREKLSELPYLRARDEEIKILHNTNTEEVSILSNHLSVKSAALDASKARITELEGALNKHDTVVAEQKRLLRVVKEQFQEQLAAVESKYKALRSVNQRLEEHLLESYRLEAHPPLSPDNSSVLSGASGGGDRTLSGSIEHAVSGSLDHGGSPLSVSLASSEGLNSSLLATHVDEIKNLQNI